MKEGSIQRLVMLFPGALGDLLLALPAMRAVRRRYPGPATLVVTEPLRPLARLIGVADLVASLDDAASAWLFGGSTPPPWLDGRPVVVSWLGDSRVLAARLAEVAASVIPVSVERGPGPVPAAVAYARALGVAIPQGELAGLARIDPPESLRVGRLFETLTRPVLAVHAGAGAAGKRWTLQGFGAVAETWRRKGGDVIQLLGPAERGDPPIAGAVAVRDWPLPDVAAALRHSDAFAGNDSGIAHLAGAVGTPGVVVFTTTDPARWRPLSPRIDALRGGAGADGPQPPATQVLRALRRAQSLTSTYPGTSVRGSRGSSRLHP